MSNDTGGITVNADDVTIDLNGFALLGGGGGTVTGISVPNAQKDLHVLNGTIRDWSNGGVRAFAATNSLSEKLRVSNNTGGVAIAGMLVGSRSTVRNCVAANNSSPGIQSAELCAITGCSSSSDGAEGFSLGSNVTVTHCTAGGNTADGTKVGEDALVQESRWRCQRSH